MSDDALRSDVLRGLTEVGALLRDSTVRQQELYHQRMNLLQRGRSFEPPITVAAMADALGQSPKAIDQVLTKERRRQRNGASA